VSWAPDYATLAELKAYVSPAIQDGADDATLALAISAASRAIDRSCGRQFGQLAAPAARTYTPTSAGRSSVVVDDLMTTEGLVVEVLDSEGGWDTPLVLDDTFKLYPWNAAADGRPWTMLTERSASTGAGRPGLARRRIRKTAARIKASSERLRRRATADLMRALFEPYRSAPVRARASCARDCE